MSQFLACVAHSSSYVFCVVGNCRNAYIICIRNFGNRSENGKIVRHAILRRKPQRLVLFIRLKYRDPLRTCEVTATFKLLINFPQISDL